MNPTTYLSRPLLHFFHTVLAGISVCAIGVLFMGAPSPALASMEVNNRSWQAILKDHPAAPPRLIAVDKDKQQLYVYDNGGRLELKRSYICTTGQKVGDKQVQGDLKTPEGIYFVVQHLDSGLDFLLYGNEAYTLNYPNPADRLRRKTGYGIWIHGRGETIRPLITQGCVAMQNDDLEILGDLLVPGTPVALTSSLAHSKTPSEETVKTAGELRKKVEHWAKAWSNRSTSMFDFYDQSAYSIAQGEDFSKFKAQKERLFKNLPWIKTTVKDIQVLQGPDYWVTWFYQDYQAPNLSTKGVRRLYWHKNAKGEFVILGMEWMPGMTTGTQLATAEPATPPIDLTPRSEEQATPLPEAIAAVAIEKEQALKANTQAAPRVKTDHVDNPEMSHFAKPELALALHSQKKLPSQTGAGVAAQAAPQIPDQPQQAVEAHRPSTVPAAQQSAPSVVVQLDIDLPPPLPAQGLGTGAETVFVAAAPETATTPQLPTPGLQTDTPPVQPQVPQVLTPEAPQETPRIDPVAPQPVVETPQAAAKPDEPAAAPQEATELAQVEEAATTEQPTASSDLDATTERVVLDTVEEWREAWEKGDLELYAEFYTENAVQGGRKGRKSIARHKSGLWQKASPKKVVFSNIKVKRHKDSILVEFEQTYADNRGQGDHGLKTLRLEHMEKMWFITSEEWRAVPR